MKQIFFSLLATLFTLVSYSQSNNDDCKVCTDLVEAAKNSELEVLVDNYTMQKSEKYLQQIENMSHSEFKTKVKESKNGNVEAEKFMSWAGSAGFSSGMEKEEYESHLSVFKSLIQSGKFVNEGSSITQKNPGLIAVWGQCALACLRRNSNVPDIEIELKTGTYPYGEIFIEMPPKGVYSNRDWLKVKASTLLNAELVGQSLEKGRIFKKGTKLKAGKIYSVKVKFTEEKPIEYSIKIGKETYSGWLFPVKKVKTDEIIHKTEPITITENFLFNTGKSLSDGSDGIDIPRDGTPLIWVPNKEWGTKIKSIKVENIPDEIVFRHKSVSIEKENKLRFHFQLQNLITGANDPNRDVFYVFVTIEFIQ